MGGVLIVLVSGQFSSQTVYASEGQCVAASEIVANNGLVSGSWSDTGVARNSVFDCIADVCRYTGEIATWMCADPSFTYAGPDTGYEYTYSFTSPGNGTCTFIEYEEGFLNQNILLPVVDWFLVAANEGSVCGPGDCVAYIWENVKQPVCGGSPAATCSFYEFAVVEGQTFFLVADIFAGLDAENPEVYPFNETWNVEIKCDLEGREIFIDGFEAAPDLKPGSVQPGAASWQ